MKTINLSKGKKTMVDDDWYPMLSCLSWHAVFNGRVWYAANSLLGRMHQLIMPLDLPLVVDHIDGDGLNNQISNLRISTISQNNANHRANKKGKNKNCSSIYKGVVKSSPNRWMSYITANKKRIYLGCFKDEIEAAKTYDKHARIHFGEFASINFGGQS